MVEGAMCKVAISREVEWVCRVVSTGAYCTAFHWFFQLNMSCLRSSHLLFAIYISHFFTFLDFEFNRPEPCCISSKNASQS